MSLVPVVTATPNKTSYAQGEPVTVTFSVPADTRNDVRTRVIDFTGRDGEGNVVSGNISIVDNIPVPDGFTLDLVKWRDTGQAFTVVGLVASSTA